MSTYSGRSSSGSDYILGLPEDIPGIGTTLRGIMDYRESIYEGTPANYDQTSNTSSTCSGCSTGDDDAFYERQGPFMTRQATPYAMRIQLAPVKIQLQPDSPIRSSTCGTSSCGSEVGVIFFDDSPSPDPIATRKGTPYALRIPLAPVRIQLESDSPAPYDSPAPNMSTPYSTSRFGSVAGDDDVFYEGSGPARHQQTAPYYIPSPIIYPIRYPRSPDDSRNEGSRGLSSYSTNDFSSSSDEFTVHPNYSDHVSRTTLPSWPDTPSPVHPRIKRMPYLSPYDKYDPPWDMQTRHSEGNYRSPGERWADISF